MTWQRNPSPVAAGDLADGHANYGTGQCQRSRVLSPDGAGRDAVARTLTPGPLSQAWRGGVPSSTITATGRSVESALPNAGACRYFRSEPHGISRFGGTAAFRSEVRDFIRERCPAELRGANTYDGVPDNLREPYDAWRRALAAKGWVAAGWPKEYGGAGLTPLEQFVFNQETAEAAAPSVGGMGVMMLGPTLIVHGNEEQKKQHLGGILSGEVRGARVSASGLRLGLASLQTRAVRDGDDWIITARRSGRRCPPGRLDLYARAE